MYKRTSSPPLTVSVSAYHFDVQVLSTSIRRCRDPAQAPARASRARISWADGVSTLHPGDPGRRGRDSAVAALTPPPTQVPARPHRGGTVAAAADRGQIGRASCRERGQVEGARSSWTTRE